jgi:AcrR family transcriptional regulator
MIFSPSDRASKRSLLVESAARVFAEKGYAATRVADIAVRAGVGKGTVYEYFGSKEELLFAVFELLNHDITVRMRMVLGGDEPIEEQLFNLLRLGAEVVTEQVELQPVLLDFWAVSRGTGLEARHREAVIATYHVFRGMVSDFIKGGQREGAFRPDVDAEAVAATVIAAVDGLGIQTYFDPSIDARAVTESFARLLYDSLSAEPA